MPIAFDGGGNEYCVDLAPGPNGAVGQMIAMEFQDGQGPYLARWTTLEAMLLDHLRMLSERKFTLTEDALIEYDYE